MKLNLALVGATTVLIVSGLQPAMADEPAPLNLATPAVADTVIPVSSPAFAFSPANWSGKEGRVGSQFRQTWYSGAYFRVHWTSSTATPSATLLFDVSGYDTSYPPPKLTLNIDGVWKNDVPCAAEIKLDKLAGAGSHVLTVYVASSEQRDRWGVRDFSGRNVVRVQGLRVDAGAQVETATAGKKWMLEIGDSITEGIGAAGNSDNLSSYSYFVGQAMQDRGYEYAVSACGWSGWLHRGDNPPGDVPAYYLVSGSNAGVGGTYDEKGSRWNKIDANNSLLDSRGRLSAYGGTDQEPAIITINYGTNDGLSKANPSDVQASITQSLAALRKAAPKAEIFIIIPFGQYLAPQLKASVNAHLAAHPRDKNVTIIDLGNSVSRAIGANGYWGNLHPNMRGHAVFAARIVGAIERKLATTR